MKKIIVLTLVLVSTFVSYTYAQTPKKWSKSLGIVLNASMSLDMTSVTDGLSHSNKVGVIGAVHKGKNGFILNIHSGNAATLFYTYALPKDRTLYVVGSKSFMASNGYVGVGAMQKVSQCQAFVDVGTTWNDPAPQLSVGLLLPVTVFKF